jgi:hypothetical protein
MLTAAGREAGGEEVDGCSLLDGIAREGARRMLLAALEREVAAYLEAHATDRDAAGQALGWSATARAAPETSPSARGRSR